MGTMQGGATTADGGNATDAGNTTHGGTAAEGGGTESAGADGGSPGAGGAEQLGFMQRLQNLGAKTDLNYGLLAEDVRPRYTFESGALDYGPLRTDADFTAAAQEDGQLTWSFINATGLRYREQRLFEARPNQFFQNDPAVRIVSASKWKRWDGVDFLQE